MTEDTDSISVSELRQWLYCPRVVWYGRMFSDRRPTSGLMKVGIEEELERKRLEDRRTFAAYGIEGRNRLFQVRVQSQVMGLRGMVDMVIETTDTTFEMACNYPAYGETLFVPVEVKTTTSPYRRPPMVQLCAYAMMIEEMTSTSVPFGFVVTRPDEKINRVEFSHDLRLSVELLIQDIRLALDGDELPPPTSSRGKCQACEFRRFCNDVW